MNLDPLCWTRTTTILLLTKRVTPIYIEDKCVVQDPQNIEIKINLKGKNESSKNKAERKKLIRDDHENYVNINYNTDSGEIKSMSEMRSSS